MSQESFVSLVDCHMSQCGDTQHSVVITTVDCVISQLSQCGVTHVTGLCHLS